jgi:hypothetical protein
MIRPHSRLLPFLVLLLVVSLALLAAGWTWDGGSVPAGLS